MYDLLSGLRIIEVSSFVASPTAGLYCAQFGADVVRIDHKAGGLDYDRYMMTAEGRSLSWENLNRAKKSVALDLQSGEGRELASELVRATGQLITNLPVNSFLAHDKLAAGRPDLVSVRIMGWHDGRQAMDFTVNAASGYPLMTGPEDWDPASAPPVNQVLPAWDFITGCRWAMLRSGPWPMPGRWLKCSIAAETGNGLAMRSGGRSGVIFSAAIANASWSPR
jgi:2-methylfumaryl-CoA isomerase